MRYKAREIKELRPPRQIILSQFSVERALPDRQHLCGLSSVSARHRKRLPDRRALDLLHRHPCRYLDHVGRVGFRWLDRRDCRLRAADCELRRTLNVSDPLAIGLTDFIQSPPQLLHLELQLHHATDDELHLATGYSLARPQHRAYVHR